MVNKSKVKSKLWNKNPNDYEFRPFKFGLLVNNHKVTLNQKIIYINKDLGESVFRINNSKMQLFAVAFPNLLYKPKYKNINMKFFIHFIGHQIGFEYISTEDLYTIINSTTESIIKKNFGLSKNFLKVKLKCKIFEEEYTKTGICPMSRRDLASGLCPVLNELYNPIQLMKEPIKESIDSTLQELKEPIETTINVTPAEIKKKVINQKQG